MRLPKLIRAAAVFPFLLWLVAGACSFHPRVERFQEFADLSGRMGECLNEVYQEVSAAEWELRRQEAQQLEHIDPVDLEPSVFTVNNRRNRSRICEYISRYPALLLSVVAEDSSPSVKRQAEGILSRIIAIQRMHPDWISPAVAGLAAAVLGMMPDLLFSGKKRKLVLQTMRANHPVLSILCGELVREMQDCRVWVKRCLARRFRLEISNSWPGTESRRGSYAKAGMKMLQHGQEVVALLDEVESGIPELVSVHGELIRNLQLGKDLWPAICRFSQALERMKCCLEDCDKTR